MVRHVEAQAEEKVVPEEHLHVRRLRRVQRHDVAINNGHSPSCCSSNKVTVGLLQVYGQNRLCKCI